MEPQTGQADQPLPLAATVTSAAEAPPTVPPQPLSERSPSQVPLTTPAAGPPTGSEASLPQPSAQAAQAPSLTGSFHSHLEPQVLPQVLPTQPQAVPAVQPLQDQPLQQLQQPGIHRQASPEHPSSVGNVTGTQPSPSLGYGQSGYGQSGQNPGTATSAASAMPHLQSPYQSAPTYQASVAASGKANEKPKSNSGLVTFFVALGGVVVGGLLCLVLVFAVGGILKPTGSTAANLGSSGSAITITPQGEDSTLASAVAAKALPSVVNIDVYVNASSGYGLGLPFGNRSERYGSGDSSTDEMEESGLGSGIVLTQDGYILTNYHVVQNGDQFMVRFDQDNQFKAEVVGTDPSSDLAILKVDATGLTPIEVADSAQVKVGEWVMALGSPFGLEKSVSTGIVSALFRSTTMNSSASGNPSIYANMIQTDAAVNPGSSGGPLVNSEGKLIGVNTLISSSTGSSAGVGFAIPSNYAMNVAKQLMAGKTVEHAYLGVQMSTVDLANSSGAQTSAKSGAYIEAVMDDSPAKAAGLQKGDVIIKVGGTVVDSADGLIIEIRGRSVGDKVTLDIVRGDKTQTVDVTLGSDTSSSTKS
ncbi:MAG: trypsin-like peptidase domain-containing protein [Actinomycetia bacterium]|nr:trypsin-like peptidase domain-containing protein [Actinomycetes bacterium]